MSGLKEMSNGQIDWSDGRMFWLSVSNFEVGSMYPGSASDVWRAIAQV